MAFIQSKAVVEAAHLLVVPEVVASAAARDVEVAAEAHAEVPAAEAVPLDATTTQKFLQANASAFSVCPLPQGRKTLEKNSNALDASKNVNSLWTKGLACLDALDSFITKISSVPQRPKTR